MIYVNARFLTQNLTGVQRFAENIALCLKELRADIVFLSPRNIIRKDIAEKLNVQIIGTHTGHLWEQVDLPLYLRSRNGEILLNLCNTAPLSYSNKVIVLHDITYLRFPQSYSWAFRFFYKILTPKIIKKSLHVFTVSEFSKRELKEIYGINESNISVIKNAVQSNFEHCDNEDESVREKKDKYFLAVSSPAYHKNFARLVSAFVKFSKLYGYDINLKIVGKAETNFKSISSDFNQDCVQYVGRVSDEELISLYKNALAFVFPSIYEGFGIPPLEAQACNCPVISSNSASMPEVLQNSALYFDPENENELITCLNNIIINPELRDELIFLGRKNIERYSWSDSAIKLNNIIDTL
ncbi:glycosyltransferase family 4 protein [Klebsiella pneumoniae]|uniref:glycosyltransferase family 4 protein n=1 Tax=Klebsiella pneumoniae TaxID=573 RepID=UPI001B8B1C2D|nr:glycosyltransferase family 1 protein [Klebsiella pneumoniae]MBS2910799.1 glycosyltransferase family 4 protein [Klebsiella pneumoniae]